MQNDFALPGAPLCVAGAAATIPRIAAILEAFRRAELPVFHARREYRADGSNVEKVRQRAFFSAGGFLLPGSAGAVIVDELSPREHEPVFTKPRFSAFMMTDLLVVLQRRAIRRLVVAGTQLPDCVRSTVYDALCYDFDVIVLRDGTSSQREEVHEANLADLSRVGATIDTCLEVIRQVDAGLLARP